MIPLFGIQGAAIATLIGFYSVWLVRATVSNGGIKIRQNFIIIHVLLGLEILQTIALVCEFPYKYLVQVIICALVLFINRGVIVKSYIQLKKVIHGMKKGNN